MESFRFLHASDFHLDETPRGLTELPDDLVEHLIDATYRAVDSVFDTAIEERVDFVLLAGDVVHFPTASPRALEFLAVQFERLHQKRIPIYWLGGELESGAGLPRDFPLPGNVQRMATSRVQTMEIKREKRTLGYVVGQSCSDHGYPNLEDMRVPRDGRFFVGMWYAPDPGQVDVDQLDDLGIDYWALGGSHEQSAFSTVIPAQYCGTPQGRRPWESGPHGCLLVSVTGDQIDRSQFVETDALRYRTERIEVGSGDDQQTLLNKMKSRLQTIRQDISSQQPLLVTWEVVDDGPIGKQLRTADGQETFLQLMRRETRDSASQNTWTIGLRSIRTAIPSRLLEEDSIVGDFLRVVRDLDASGSSRNELERYLPNTEAARQIQDILPADSPKVRDELLRDVTTMGIDLLCGDTA